jgi:hypothetical protein
MRVSTHRLQLKQIRLRYLPTERPRGRLVLKLHPQRQALLRSSWRPSALDDSSGENAICVIRMDFHLLLRGRRGKMYPVRDQALPKESAGGSCTPDQSEHCVYEMMKRNEFGQGRSSVPIITAYPWPPKSGVRPATAPQQLQSHSMQH